MRALLALIALLGLAAGATFDQALSNAGRGGVGEDTVFITFRDVSVPRHRHHTLLSIAFPRHSRFAIILDRAQGQVVFESVHEGETEKQRVTAPDTLKTDGLVSSLLVELDQRGRRAAVYGDCDLLGTVPLAAVPRDMMQGDDADEMRTYRDRHVDVSVDWHTSLLELLDKLGCSEAPTPEVQSQGNEIYTYRRGDIPILHDDQSSVKLVSTISELIETIKELQIEIQTQREETTLLRDALINCELCKPGRGFTRR